MTDLLRELRTAAIWAAFGLGVFFATRPIWSYLLFGPDLTFDDLLFPRCFGLLS
jgi:hypothetical protein